MEKSENIRKFVEIVKDEGVASAVSVKFRKISEDFRGCGQMKILGHEWKTDRQNVLSEVVD